MKTNVSSTVMLTLICGMRIAMRDLVPTTGDQVYEAWMILPNTPPAPVGGLTVGSDGSGFIEAGGVHRELLERLDTRALGT